MITLLAASVLAAWMSEILVGAAEETGKALGMSQVFIGIVFVAIVGGAAESGSAIAMARKNKMDLSVGIALGSCIQIALFVAPLLVLASYFIAPQPLELAFGRAEIGSLLMAVLIGALVCGDGQSNWFKGVQLITVYAIVAFMFYLIPEVGNCRHSGQSSLLTRPVTINSYRLPPSPATFRYGPWPKRNSHEGEICDETIIVTGGASVHFCTRRISAVRRLQTLGILRRLFSAEF